MLEEYDRQQAGPQDTVLSVTGLVKSFRSNWGRKIKVLHDVTFSVPRGEVFGLLGPNGAGKSTTMKIVLGMMRPSGGGGTLLGHPLGSLQPRKRVGFLPESPYFYQYLTAREFLETCADLHGTPRKGRAEAIEALLERVGLNPKESRRLQKFSKGMLQRVGLAQAILHDPDLVVLDEPMSGLDPVGRRQVRELILSLRDEGKTVIFSSHVLPDAEALCDRVAILVDGRIQRTGRVSDLVRHDHAGYDVEVGDLSPQLFDGLAGDGIASRNGDRIVIHAVNQAELNWRLRQLMDAKANIIAVRPITRSLEEVFLSELGSAAPQVGEPDHHLGRGAA